MIDFRNVCIAVAQDTFVQQADDLIVFDFIQRFIGSCQRDVNGLEAAVVEIDRLFTIDDRDVFAMNRSVRISVPIQRSHRLQVFRCFIGHIEEINTFILIVFGADLDVLVSVGDLLRVDDEGGDPMAVEHLEATVSRLADHTAVDGPQCFIVHGFLAIIGIEKAVGEIVDKSVLAGDDFLAGSGEQSAQIVLLGLDHQAIGARHLLNQGHILKHSVQLCLRGSACDHQHEDQSRTQDFCQLFH